MRLTVTLEDHEKAVRAWRRRNSGRVYTISERCPVAVALRRTCHVRVAQAFYSEATAGKRRFALSKSVTQWIKLWDNALYGLEKEFPTLPVTFTLREKQ